ANGKTIMTTQPRFVPAEAVKIELESNVSVNVRLVDCVGYLAEGAQGHLDGGTARLVRTPWDESEIPFEKAAEIGTKRVINEHSTIGIVVTTDGSIATELPRSAYEAAEERAILELQALNKPFVVILNSKIPDSPQTTKLASQLEAKYGTKVLAVDVLNLSDTDIREIFKGVLYEFPLVCIEVDTSKWIQALPVDSPVIDELISVLYHRSENKAKMRDFIHLIGQIDGGKFFDELILKNVDLGSGKIVLSSSAKSDLFYKALSTECGEEISDDFVLMSSIKSLVEAKRAYEKIDLALNQAKETGYGVVRPSSDEMTLEEPQIVRQGGAFGVKLKATAPSLHIMRVDIESEVSPIVGSEAQSEQLTKSLMAQFESDPKGIWQTDIFGRSLHSLVNDGLNNKLVAMPIETQKKMRKTLGRIVNEGKGGVICILL
ncbi:MAG: stage IV sporulation protein A, partial [Firmicutes bacterium]|nr:stage IV sporulation protein A [Bacillota bacterium]